MKTLHTSYYARNGKHPKAVAISASPPPFYTGKRYPNLAPTWDILNDYKSGQIDEHEYTTRYLQLLRNRNLTPEQVVDELEDGTVLLCYETPEKFCHRHIVAIWLMKVADLEITELEPIKKPQPKSIVDELFEF